MRLERTLQRLSGLVDAYRTLQQRLAPSPAWRKVVLFKDFLYGRYRGVVKRTDFEKIYRELTTAQQSHLTYIAMVIVAANIATLGLLMNNAPVIIGAMIISPLMGPIMAGGLSFAIGDYPLGKHAFRSILLGIVLSLVFSALITLLSPMKSITPEILARTAPTILDMIIAIFSGVAATLAVLFDSVSGSIIGVAISVALMPPLCVVGIGIGLGRISIAMGSLFMFLTNLSAIFIASAVIFLVFGFYTYLSLPNKRQIILKYGVSLGALIILSIPLFYTLSNAINNKAIYDKINNVLMEHLNTGNKSEIASWNLSGNSVTVTVDSLSYISAASISRINTDINQATGHRYTLDVTQVPVLSLSQNGKQSVSSVMLNVLSGKILAENTALKTAQENNSRLQQKLADLVKIFPYVEYYRIIYDDQTNVTGLTVLLNPNDAVTTGQIGAVIRYLNSNTNNVALQVSVISNNILVPPIYFDEDRYDVGQAYLQELTTLAAFLKSQPQYNVKIVGSADGTGSVYINQYLSRMRAETVRDDLVRAGVAPQTINISYAQAPATSTILDQGRQSERSVDLQLIPGQ